MSITIRGVRINSLSITTEDGKQKVTGSYSLMSNDDIELAKQNFNGYSEIKVDFSASTTKAINEFVKGAKKDVESTLGLTE